MSSLGKILEPSSSASVVAIILQVLPALLREPATIDLIMSIIAPRLQMEPAALSSLQQVIKQLCYKATDATK